MAKYLVELKHSVTGDMTLAQVETNHVDAAKEMALKLHPDCTAVKVKGMHGGKREGAGRVSQWGDGVETDRRRLPVRYSRQAEEVIGELEMVNAILQSWEGKVQESKSRSKDGQPAERYKYVAQLVSDLKKAMIVTGDSLV